jgi:outer membrane translocation and assembly module TamA
VGVGPVAKYTMSDLPPGTPFQRENRFDQDVGQVGALGVAEWDLRDNPVFPERGARLQLGASAYPAVWSVPEPFGEVHGVASAYLTPSWGWHPTLAVRAGGKKLWGDFPVHEAAFLGGSRTVRGYPYQRFAGDALVFGNAEVRAPLGTVNLLLARGQLGALALADAGRVYVDGESSDQWHTALGTGLWFRFTVRDAVLGASVTYARGEDEGRVYLKLGGPF